MILGQTRYEAIGGSWFVVIESTDESFVEAEVARLQSRASFIGPYKVDDMYVAKGMIFSATLQ